MMILGMIARHYFNFGETPPARAGGPPGSRPGPRPGGPSGARPVPRGPPGAGGPGPRGPPVAGQGSAPPPDGSAIMMAAARTPLADEAMEEGKEFYDDVEEDVRDYVNNLV